MTCQPLRRRPSRSTENPTWLSLAVSELDARVRAVDVAEALTSSPGAAHLANADMLNPESWDGDVDLVTVPAAMSAGLDELELHAVEIHIAKHIVQEAGLSDARSRSSRCGSRPPLRHMFLVVGTGVDPVTSRFRWFAAPTPPDR